MRNAPSPAGNRTALALHVAGLETFADVLAYRAQSTPDAIGYRFLDADGSEAGHLTYAELDRSARIIAAELAATARPTERTILLHQPGLEFIRSLFGCFYAGSMAIPCHAPGVSFQPSSETRLQAVAADALPDAVLTDSVTIERSIGLRQIPELMQAHWIVSDQSRRTRADSSAHEVAGDTIAMLQYSSGSTTAPRGVMLSHRNLLANQEMIRVAFGHDAETVVASWLPMHHDMGLIGAVLQPLYVGVPCILMSPATFFRSPWRWLDAISRYGATTSGAPDFAFDLCVRRIPEERRRHLDLGRWRVAFNGAEPIRSATLAAFADAFMSCGFRRTSLLPCYGLAEATLMVSAGPAELGPRLVDERTRNATRPKRTVVACGAVARGLDLRIVDPKTQRPKIPGQIGEIWLSGPSVAQGYWNRPRETEEAFRARIAGASISYLRTGDLGFVQDGQVFVTGRCKELMILHGRNLYPSDLEVTIERSSGRRSGKCVVFSHERNGQERLIVVQEVAPLSTDDARALVGRIQEALTSEHGVAAEEIVFVRRGSIPKTTSGKRQRAACRLLWQRKQLDRLHVHAPALGQVATEAVADTTASPSKSSLLDRIQAHAARIAGLASDALDISQPLAVYGFDSISSLQLVHALEAELGFSLSLRVQGRLPTVESLCQLAQAACSLKSEASARTQNGPFRLSAGQNAIWFESMANGRPELFNTAVAARLGPDAQMSGFRWALGRLVKAHAALRTRIVMRDGLPAQTAPEDGAIQTTEIDASGWSSERLHNDLITQANRPFDLVGGALARAYIYGGAGHSVVLLVVHHLICDLRSLEIILGDLTNLYEAWRVSALVSTPQPRHDYRDYVEWQQAYLTSEEAEHSRSYWRRQLAGYVPLSLRTDRSRPLQPTFRSQCIMLSTNAENTAAIEALARNFHTTPFSVLLAVLTILLAHELGRWDIGVATPTTNRGSHRFADVVGHFINPVLIRNELRPQAPFAEFLQQVERAVADALAHQNLPFPAVIEIINPPRFPGRQPLYNVMLVLQQSWDREHESLGSLALGQAAPFVRTASLELQPVSVERGISHLDLTVTLAKVGGAYCGNIEFACDLFDSATIEALARRYVTMLSQFSAAPALAVGTALPSLEFEPTTVFSEINLHSRMDEPITCLHQRFCHRVAATPNAAAVVAETGIMTYGELDARSNSLARELRRHGVKPGSRVAFCLTPSTRMIIAVVAILKAGAAYVPLDPADPPHRLAYILGDSMSGLLIVDDTMSMQLPALHIPVLPGTAIDACVGQNDAAAGEIASVPEAPAYLIYTSGSSGVPKGMLISHANVDRLFEATRKRFDFGASDVWTLFHSPAFDFSVWEMWGALRHGGRLVVLPDWVRRSPGALRSWLGRHGVTVLNQTPSAFYQFARNAVVNGFADRRLRYVILGGEMLDFGALRGWMDLCGDDCPELVNMYGLTETTVHVTYRRIRRSDVTEKGSPIGGPIADTQIYLLDDELTPVPPGFTGEIFVGGPGLGHGYNARAALTASRFIPNPFAHKSGERLYRTGDCALRRENGELVFCGRRDSQVKIRGFRVELQEIETALQQHPSVERAIVLYQPTSAGGHELVAYVLGAQQPGLAYDLQAHLRRLLPAHMVPSGFSWLDTIPLTRNGKLDVGALAGIRPQRAVRDGHSSAPSGELEQQLKSLWSSLLGVDDFGVEDSFFDLGGHSLLLQKMGASLAELTGQEVSLAELYRLTTIRVLAQFLREERGVSIEQGSGAERARTRVRLTHGERNRRAGRSTPGKRVQ